MKHRTLKRQIWLVCLAVAMWLLAGITVAADDGLCTPVVTALDAPGFIELEGLEVSTTVSCGVGQCTAVSQQRLYLVNRDQGGEAVVTVGLASCGATLSDWVANGATSAEDGATARLTIASRAKADLAVTVTTTVPESAVLSGEVRLSDAGRWGKIDHAHVVLRLPIAAVGPNVGILPQPDLWSGQSGGVWDWAQTTDDITWAVVSPSLRQELAEAISAGDNLGLAEALAAAGAADSPLPAWRQVEPQLLAALHTAVDASPDAPRPHLLLADAYLTLAEARPDRRLNYLLLALQQLDAISGDATPLDELNRRKGETLYQAAMAAHEGGDPASALAYLTRAAALTDDARVQRAQDQFVLQWGLDLARQGQVAAAIALLDDAGQLPIARELARFAPPFQHARTQVTLAPNSRTASYAITLYAPVAAETRALVNQELEAILALPGVQVAPPDANASELHLSITIVFDDLAQLYERQILLIEAVSVYDGLVPELLLAPWRGEVTAWSLDAPYWGRQLRYAETTDTAAFQAAWQAGADTAGWWLVELRNRQPAAPGSVAEDAAHELALLALREQSALWATLPEQAQWVYQLDHPALATAPRWQLASGELRPLDYNERWYDWRRGGQAAIGLGAALLALALMLDLLVRRRRRRRETSH